MRKKSFFWGDNYNCSSKASLFWYSLERWCSFPSLFPFGHTTSTLLHWGICMTSNCIERGLNWKRNSLCAKVPREHLLLHHRKRWRPKKVSQCRRRKKTKKLLCFSSMHNDDSQASNARWSNKPSLVVHLVVDSSGLGLSSACWRSSAATCHLLHSQSSYLIKLMNPSKESWDRRRKWEKKEREEPLIKYDLGYLGP